MEQQTWWIWFVSEFRASMEQQTWWIWSFSALAFILPFIILFFSKRSSQQQQEEEEKPSSQSSESSSPSDSLPNLPVGEYEVFLSFRGPDTRLTFTDFLYTYLVQARIRTFRDDDELRKGHTIAPELIKAIHESKIGIPIFSPNYASSKWCLQELADMVDCKRNKGQIILPVFYNVDPTDVRHQTGSYKQAFQQHEKKFSKETVDKWRAALGEVGALKGWVVKDSNGQGATIENVFSAVWSALRREYLLVTDALVGIDHHIEEMMKLLALDSNEVKVVGVHGIGGIGKTTIAKAVYNKLFQKFDHCCFIEDIRETLREHGGIVKLQNKLISGILKMESNVDNLSQGINLIRNRVCKHKVLIVLDDVDRKFEFDKVLGDKDWFSPGSRIIITTRDRKVLNILKVREMYEPSAMNPDHSLQLFSKHAFGMDSPPEDYAEISADIVSALAGLPSVLKDEGSVLFGEDREVWEETLMKLRDKSNGKVDEKLKASTGS
ncbi:Disease resistance protein L6 [Linum perenne]